MAEQQLSIRSTKAHNLAQRAAKRYKRTITQVVEDALSEHVNPKRKAATQPESAADFYARMRQQFSDDDADLDLAAIIKMNRIDHSGPAF